MARKVPPQLKGHAFKAGGSKAKAAGSKGGKVSPTKRTGGKGKR
jgi:hypothetical protein